jgi:Cys-rich protein (TIGR01571 family)
MPEFQNSLFGCFGNCTVCICTYFIPCYVSGKIAEKVGENCLLHGAILFVPLVNLFCLATIRGKVRDQKGIPGSFVVDLLTFCFCATCALCQEAQEMNALDMASDQLSAMEMARE